MTSGKENLVDMRSQFPSHMRAGVCVLAPVFTCAQFVFMALTLLMYLEYQLLLINERHKFRLATVLCNMGHR